MRKSVFISVIGLSVLFSLIVGICLGKSVKSVNGKTLVGLSSSRSAEMTTEMAEYVSEKYENRKEGFKRYWKNPWYAMFYGEWEPTDIVYVDRLPLQGVQGGGFLTEEERENLKVEFAGREKEKTHKIKFAQDQIVVNDNDIFENVRYDMTIFPAMDNYLIHFTMTLADIGLTEENGSYYIFVEVDGDKGAKSQAEEWNPDDSILLYFFIKDENTIIVFHGSWCIEYKRVSYEGGNESPAIIKG